MINLRYHIVSLVAVFLALAIGIIVGTTTIDQSVVARLEQQKGAADAREAKLRDEKDAVIEALRVWQSFGEAQIPGMLAGELDGHTVVLLQASSVDGGFADPMHDSLEDAGATIRGTVRFTDKWRLDSREDREQLALAIGAPLDEPEQLLADAAARLAARLAAPANARADGDLLHELDRAGFVELVDVPSEAFPPAGADLVILAEGTATQQPATDTFFTPFLRALHEDVVVAAAEPLDADTSVVEAIRKDGDLRDRVASVDHGDTLPGRYALAVALRALAEGRGAQHFGIRGKTSGVVPAPTATATPTAASTGS